jgi:hypothetical protein
MSGGRGKGTLVLSVDLELDLDHQEPPLQKRLDEVRRLLIDLTQTHRLSATWAVADPTLSAATESILAAGCGHEIAVLGDRAWLGPGCGRQRLARELTRRFDAARRAGIAVSTLSLRNVEQVFDLDLLLDHGVTALRGPAADTLAPARKLGKEPIRYGIWLPPTPRKLPPLAAWWTPAPWLVRREIKRAIRQQCLVHFEIDAARLVASHEQALALVAATLRYAAAKRDAGQLEICTIGELAARALAERSAAPSRSILRPAA